jgi:hypothetical protein
MTTLVEAITVIAIAFIRKRGASLLIVIIRLALDYLQHCIHTYVCNIERNCICNSKEILNRTYSMAE